MLHMTLRAGGSEHLLRLMNRADVAHAARLIAHIAAESRRLHVTDLAFGGEHRVRMRQWPGIVDLLLPGERAPPQPQQPRQHQSERKQPPPSRDLVDALEIIQVDPLSEIFRAARLVRHISNAVPPPHEFRPVPAVRSITAHAPAAMRAASGTAASAGLIAAALRKFVPEPRSPDRTPAPPLRGWKKTSPPAPLLNEDESAGDKSRQISIGRRSPHQYSKPPQAHPPPPEAAPGCAESLRKSFPAEPAQS